MHEEEYVSPDRSLRLVVTRDDEGDLTIGFAGFSWHTHGDLLAASYPLANAEGLTPETASQRFIADVVGNRATIVVQSVAGEVRDVWVTADHRQELANVASGESLRFRLWDGTEVGVSEC